MIETLDGATSLKWLSDPVFNWLGPLGLEFLDKLQEEENEDEENKDGQVFDDGISKNQLRNLAVFGLVALLLILAMAIFGISYFLRE